MIFVKVKILYVWHQLVLFLDHNEQQLLLIKHNPDLIMNSVMDIEIDNNFNDLLENTLKNTLYIRHIKHIKHINTLNIKKIGKIIIYIKKLI